MSPQCLTSDAYGRVVSVTIRGVPIDQVRPLLPHWWADRGDNGGGQSEHEVEIGSLTDAREAVRHLEFWVAEHATQAVFVHAGVVAVDGRAILIAGRSHTGKSRLTAALLRAGAAYGSDEYAVLTPEGQVCAYPRPLALRASAGGIDHVKAEELGSRAFEAALPIGVVADVRFEPHATWAVEPMSRAQAVLHLIDNAVAAQTRTTAVFETIVAASRTITTAIRGIHGDADRAAAELIAAARLEVTPA